MFQYVPEHFITPKKCVTRLVRENNDMFKYVPDWFVTAEMLEKYQDEEMAGLKSYKQRKAQKAKIKEELLPVAWHPDRVIDWCFSEDEKEVLEKLWKR